MPAEARKREPVQMEIRVRSFLGSFFCKSENALMMPKGSVFFFKMGSVEPPGINKISKEERVLYAVGKSMVAGMERGSCAVAVVGVREQKVISKALVAGSLTSCLA